MPANEVNILITAKDQASAKISGVASKLAGPLKMGAAVGAAAVVGIGVAAIKMAADFDTAFGEVTTLFDGSKRQNEELRSGVKDLAREMGVDATTAAEALYQAISAGVAPDNAVAFLRENTRFAVAGVTDLKTAVDATTTVLNAWGLEASQLTRVQDVLFSGVRAGKTTVDELGASLFQVAPVAAAAGVDIENVTASLATLTAAGVPTNVAATQLRQAFVELGKEGSKASKVFEDTAGVSFQGFIAAGNDVDDVMRVLNQASNELDVSVGDLFGSVEAGQAATVLAGEGWQALTDNLDSARDATGLTDEAFDRMNGTFGRQFEILQGQLKGILLDIGEQVLPLLINALERLNPWLQEHLPLAIAFMKEKWIELQPHIEAFAAHVRDDVLPALSDLHGFFSETLVPFIETYIIPAIQNIITVVGDLITVLGDIISFISNVFHGEWAAAWQNIKDIATGLLDLLIDYFRMQFSMPAVAIFRDMLGGIRDSVTFGMAVVKNKIIDGLNAIKNVFVFGLGVFVGFWRDLPGNILSALGDLGGLLVEAGKELVRGLIRGINDMLPSIPDITPGFDIPGVPFFHQGGIVPGPIGQSRLAVVQAGEEVIPVGGARTGAGIGPIYINEWHQHGSVEEGFEALGVSVSP